ncbi:hypothetical protein [Streptomyces profundus]|uniref:hypothetical protein n=1 Tax=Streptomyces profundus TaxID=2867410 RepID=UPI001D16FACA|nr:hypothetical protein [Streptomyces sp. MA3_2.13]UED85684.1 hypothetical protein K4G22_17005 [Streptomyces sp. MA3_2.13]
MSAGNTGQGTPDEGDDPFAYLYRPEGGAAGQQPVAPRQPSYNQVRPVGERTFGGQQGYRQQPSPDARYAAPETQGGGYGGPPDRRRNDQDSRRNGLLVGAIAVVLAVVLGIGAAILFSDDEGGDDEAGGGETTEPTGGADDGDDEGSSEGDPDPEPSDDAEPEELPAADITQLSLGGGAALEATFDGARSDSGSYVALAGRQGATVSWSFDFQGEPGMYYLYTGYSVITDDQTMSFSVNGTPREDPVKLVDYSPNDEWDTSWVRTFNQVELVRGQNTVEYTCGGSCDAAIDELFVTDEQL